MGSAPPTVSPVYDLGGLSTTTNLSFKIKPSWICVQRRGEQAQSWSGGLEAHESKNEKGCSRYPLVVGIVNWDAKGHEESTEGRQLEMRGKQKIHDEWVSGGE